MEGAFKRSLRKAIYFPLRKKQKGYSETQSKRWSGGAAATRNENMNATRSRVAIFMFCTFFFIPVLGSLQGKKNDTKADAIIFYFSTQVKSQEEKLVS